MRIGLLQCDHVLDELRNIAGDYDDMFRRWLPAEWRIYDLPRGELPRFLDECDAYVASGSKASVYDDEPWIRAFEQFVRDLHAAGKPFVGVCFGHQMMAQALGGRVAKSPNGWGIGVHRFHLDIQEPWMDPPLPAVNVLMSCQDQVEQLPPGAVALGGNSHCPVGLFRVRSLLGIQGHPEWTPDYAAALLEIRRERIGSVRVDAALDTLTHPFDSDQLALWAMRWFQSCSAAR